MSEETKPTAQEIWVGFAKSPFIAALQMELGEVDEAAGTVVVRLPMTPIAERTAGTNQFHGGPLASLIDVAGDVAVALATGGAVPTIDLRVDYLRPAFGPHVDAKAVARRVGRTVGIADVDIFGSDGKLVAIGRGCYSAKVG